MIVKFSEDATHATVAAVLNDLREWVVDLDHEHVGYPSKAVVIIDVTRDGMGEIVTICETGDDGFPKRNSPWDVPIDGLRSITIL